MRSSFNAPRRNIAASTRPLVDERYDLKGLNLIAPDQVMPDGETPLALNNRRYARNDNETRVAMRTRRGSVSHSTPVGEQEGTSNTITVTTDLEITENKWLAFKYETELSGVLTKIALRLKKAPNTGGYLLIEVMKDNDGLPGAIIAETSIRSSSVSGNYGDRTAQLMDAPQQESGEIYWIRLRVQELGTGTYYLGGRAGNTVLTSTDDGKTYTPQPFNVGFTTFMSQGGHIKGFTKRYPSTKENRTMLALGEKLYGLPDNSTTPLEIADTIHSDSQFVRFTHVDDLSFWVDGYSQLKQWDGEEVKNTPGAPPLSNNVIVFKNRLMVVPSDDPTAVRFSALYDWTKWPSVNFFYVPRPKSPDPVTGWVEFQDNLVIFTHETKHIVFGSDLSTFTRKEAVGTKGALSQEAMAVDRNNIYFIADDKMLYAYNGSTDTLMSGKVEPELQAADPNTFRLHLYRNQLRIYYMKAASGEQCMLMLDIEQGGDWYKDTGRNVMGSFENIFGDNELIEISSRSGWIFKGETGNSDVGKPIDFKYWTAYNTYGSGAARDRVRKFRPVVRPAPSPYYLLVGKDVDMQDKPDMRKWLVDSGGAAWGSFQWGDGTKYGGQELLDNRAPMSGRGKLTQYRFEHRGVDQPVEMYGYIALIKQGRAR